MSSGGTDWQRISKSMGHHRGSEDRSQEWETVSSSKRTKSLNSPNSDNGFESKERAASMNSSNGKHTDKDHTESVDMMDENANPSDEECIERLPVLLNEFINSKCQTSEHCRKSDFDGTAREALQRISFLQALQAIEHFSGSVSSRILKRSAYLMGILRGQEQHWEKSRAAASLPGGSAELLALPPVVLVAVGELCLRGNCLPSDFTPEVCLSLHRLSGPLGVKAIHAFNSNKRIGAGCRGGVLNRPRFFQRLIHNVAEQSSGSQDASTAPQSGTTTPPSQSSSYTSSPAAPSPRKPGLGKVGMSQTGKRRAKSESASAPMSSASSSSNLIEQSKQNIEQQQQHQQQDPNEPQQMQQQNAWTSRLSAGAVQNFSSETQNEPRQTSSENGGDNFYFNEEPGNPTRFGSISSVSSLQEGRGSGIFSPPPMHVSAPTTPRTTPQPGATSSAEPTPPPPQQQNNGLHAGGLPRWQSADHFSHSFVDLIGSDQAQQDTAGADQANWTRPPSMSFNTGTSPTQQQQQHSLQRSATDGWNVDIGGLGDLSLGGTKAYGNSFQSASSTPVPPSNGNDQNDLLKQVQMLKEQVQQLQATCDQLRDENMRVKTKQKNLLAGLSQLVMEAESNSSFVSSSPLQSNSSSPTPSSQH